MLRETSFKFKVLGVEPIDNGIVDPWFLQKVAAGPVAVTRLDAERFVAFEKILPGDDGLIDGIPPIDMLDGGLMGF